MSENTETPTTEIFPHESCDSSGWGIVTQNTCDDTTCISGCGLDLTWCKATQARFGQKTCIVTKGKLTIRLQSFFEQMADKAFLSKYENIDRI